MQHDAFATRLQAWIDSRPAAKDIPWGRYSWLGGSPPIDNDNLPESWQGATS